MYSCTKIILSCNKDIPPLEDRIGITKTWLAKVLREYYRSPVTILDFEVNVPDQKEGFLSEINYVTVESNLETLDLVFKFLPENPDSARYVKNGNLADREDDFYKFAVTEEFHEFSERSHASRIIPDIIYSEVDNVNFTLIMKDLRSLNYKRVIDRDGLSPLLTKAALSSLAKIHVSGLNHLKLYGTFPLKTYNLTEFYEKIPPANIKILCNAFKQDSALVSKLISIGELPVVSSPLFDTVIHGDFWAGQAMFCENECPSEASILDFQCTKIGNPTFDLLALFCRSCSSTLLDNQFEELLSYYWSSFTKCLLDNEIDLNVDFYQFQNNLVDNWIVGFYYLACTIHDFLNADIISDHRLKGIMKFLDNRNVFSNFLKAHKSSKIDQGPMD